MNRDDLLLMANIKDSFSVEEGESAAKRLLQQRHRGHLRTADDSKHNYKHLHTRHSSQQPPTPTMPYLTMWKERSRPSDMLSENAEEHKAVTSCFTYF